MLFGDDQVHVGIPLLLIFLISCCLLCFFRMFSRFYLLWSNILLSQWGFLFLYTPCAVTTSSVVCGESVCIYLYIDASSAPKLLNSLCCFQWLSCTVLTFLLDSLIPNYVDILQRGCWFFPASGLYVYAFFFWHLPFLKYLCLPLHLVDLYSRYSFLLFCVPYFLRYK